MSPGIPSAVFTIWWIGLGLTVVLFVPLAVYLLHRVLRAARSIERYCSDALQAARGIAANVEAVAALDATARTAKEISASAGSVAGQLGSAADALKRRAGG